MNGLTGMEKFSHLEDKIYLTIEVVKKLREERDSLAVEVESLKNELGQVSTGQRGSDAKVDELLAERDAIQLKVEAMLEAMMAIDPEVAAAVGR